MKSNEFATRVRSLQIKQTVSPGFTRSSSGPIPIGFRIASRIFAFTSSFGIGVNDFVRTSAITSSSGSVTVFTVSPYGSSYVFSVIYPFLSIETDYLPPGDADREHHDHIHRDHGEIEGIEPGALEVPLTEVKRARAGTVFRETPHRV